MGRLAVDSGAWSLWECENDQMTFNGKSKLILEKKIQRKPVEEWIKYQGRFSHLFKPQRDEERLKAIENYIDNLWDRYRNCYTTK
jgi:pyruvate ferredoxin oxidoreductase beta subunit